MTSWSKRDGVEILIVEDSSTQAEQLAAILETHGYRAVVAADGEQALALVRERRPALVISDVMMPKLDGYGLCGAIKKDKALRDIPLVLVTTLSDPIDVLRGLECGADNFIRKPVDDRYLLSRIDYLLMNRELRIHQKTQMGMEIDLRGQRYFINSERQQILDLLISTYEQAVDLNKELSQRERELAASNEVLDSLYRIADDLNKTVSRQDILERVLDRVMEMPDANAAWISLSDEKGGALKVMASRNLSFGTGAWALQAECGSVMDMRNGGCALLPVPEDDAFLDAVDEILQSQRHTLTIPLTLPDGGRIGAMNLVSPDEYGFDETKQQLLAGIGNQLIVALERAELHENLERRVEERTAQVKRLNRLYSVLSSVNTAIVRTRSREELFNEVCRIAIDEGHFVFAWTGTVDDAGQKVDLLAHTNAFTSAPDEVMDAVARIERSGRLQEALQSGEPMAWNNIDRDLQTIGDRTSATDTIGRSAAILPVFMEDALSCVLVLHARETDAFDDDEEMHLLREIAEDIGFALDYQEKERLLNYLAYYDSVTGLPNRTLFSDRLNQAMLEARRHEKTVGVAILDLDRFKTVNDSLGHAVGDALLKAVGERMRDLVRDGDTVSRIAGDEFGLIFSDMRQEEDLIQVVTKVLACFAQSFKVKDHEIFISASLGVTVYPVDGDMAEQLMQNADAAMYRAKAAGRNGYQFYSAELTLKARERLSLEHDLRGALERQEFVLYYQPIVNADSGHISGVETLLRWNNPERGLVPPLDFIPLAEEILLIIDLGAWVMEEACRQLSSGWAKASHLRLSVNVSTRQFLHGDFLAMMKGVIERTGVDPTRLTLEITETHLMENIKEMVTLMHELVKLGIRFSIDDFGTGYSSLAYLKNLPISSLKIDRSFVQNLPENADDASIVKTVIAMAHNLNQRVIAEGVETKEQLEFLRSHGCDALQGYYFSKPVPASEIADLLASEGSRE